jgi:hypothetical protein
MIFTIEEGLTVINMFAMWIQQARANGRNDFNAEEIGVALAAKLAARRVENETMPDKKVGGTD